MLTGDPLKGGTGRGPRWLEANHRKAHHGHIVGEGLLLRTKDPLLDLPTWGAAGREMGRHTAAPCQPSPERTHRTQAPTGSFFQLLVGRPFWGSSFLKCQKGLIIRRFPYSLTPGEHRVTVCACVVSSVRAARPPPFRPVDSPRFSSPNPRSCAHVTSLHNPLTMASLGPRVQTYR